MNKEFLRKFVGMKKLQELHLKKGGRRGVKAASRDYLAA